MYRFLNDFLRSESDSRVNKFGAEKMKDNLYILENNCFEKILQKVSSAYMMKYGDDWFNLVIQDWIR
jgi:hypothetical protein